MSGANRLGRRSAGHVCRRAAAGQRTCWRIEEEQDRIENAAWADWTQCQEVRADDILLQQTNVAAAQTVCALSLEQASGGSGVDLDTDLRFTSRC